ncbi:hypothetical protein L1049_020153 [Liquidambar formosana]|uniref:Pectinesterase inhibitor domain-containing protein n=1 Tax=Liquidambar formosana TaxID=63359 RepID=A0AAP0X764_LIQFO
MNSLISLKPIFLLHFVLLFLIFPPLSQSSFQPLAPKGSDLIDNTCKQTPYYDLCVSSLRSDPRSSSADVQGLALIITDMVLGNATDTLALIEDLLKQIKDPSLEKALAYCAELYIPVVKYDLPQAIEALTKGHYKFANYSISEAGNQADTCEKNFTGSTVSPLTDQNSLVHDLSAVAASIANKLGG